MPVYECRSKCIRSLFKVYQNALPEYEVSIGFTTFQYIVKMLTMCGELKAVLSTYYKKLNYGKSVFDHMLDMIGQMDLNSSSSNQHYWF